MSSVWQWIKFHHHLISATIWAFTLIPLLYFRSWQNSVLFVAINAIYVTVKTDIAAHHALQADKGVSDGTG